MTLWNRKPVYQSDKWWGIPPRQRSKLLGILLVCVLLFTAIYILHFYF